MTGHIRIHNLSFAYPDGTRALEDISLEIARNERIAIVGPNGAGKSTLLMHLNGILRGNGIIEVSGTRLGDDTVRLVRRKVGIVFQDPNDQLFCPTVEEDVAFGPLHFDENRGAIHAIVSQALSRVEMEEAAGRLTHHLSLGERRRVSIAAVMACNPEIVAFDEPSASLDPRRRRELIDILRAADKTVLVATHDLAFALAVCPRCIMMDRGRIVADGETRMILGDHALLARHDLEPPEVLRTGSS